MDCGCKLQFTPCATHASELEEGEHFHITISRESKYSLAPFNRHNVDLDRVQRCHLEIDTEPMELSEATLAQMAQDAADELVSGHAAFVLRALANALSGNDDNHRLILKQAKKGRWASPSDEHKRRRQHIAWIIRLSRLERQGWQTDAAVHRIAESTGNSVSRVYAGIAEEKVWQGKTTEFLALLKGARELQKNRVRRTPKSET